MLEMREHAAGPEGRGLKGIILNALTEYGGPFKIPDEYTGPKPVVMCLLLDSHWYREKMRKADRRWELRAQPNVVLEEPKLQIGVFISRTLWAWPSCLEEVVPAVRFSVISSDNSYKMTLKSSQHHLDSLRLVYRVTTEVLS